MTIHQPTRVSAAGTARLPDPSAMLDRICDHFVEHGVVTRGARHGRIESPIGNARFTLEDSALSIDIDCPDAATLFTVKSVIAEHLFMFAAGAPLTLEWHDGEQPADIAYFHLATVVSSRTITPRMRRVTLDVPDAARLAAGGLHVRLLLPPEGRPPVWPTARPDGRIRWPDGEDALVVRVYTIRSLDLARQRIDIDFVLHEGDHTPAATWSMTAAPGARIGLLGPGGGGLPEARRLLIAGDETALPAIARMAAAMTPDMAATIFIEVNDPAEHQPIPGKADIDLTWLHRDDRPGGTAGLLPQAVRDALAEGPNDDLFVWVACEHAEARAIRRYLRQDLGHDRKRHSVAAYWRRGHTGEEAGDDDR